MSVIVSYVEELRARGAKPAEFLRPGTQDALPLLRKAFPELSLPDGLADLWACFDGVDHSKHPTCDDVWLDGVFYFFSLQETIDDYRICYDLWANDPSFENYWPKGYLPIATPGDGSRLLIDCVAGSPTHAGVYELFHGIGISRSAPRIRRYFEIVSAWFDKGALKIDSDRRLEIDQGWAISIAHSMNPECDSWTGG